MAMEFWGAEVKAGEPLKVTPDEGYILHLSQACLGEVKKDKNDSALVSVNIDGKKIVIGTLSSDKCPQISYDLVFEKEFELSHNWKSGSVHFCGYKAEVQEDDEGSEGMFDSESESEKEDEPIVAVENGNTEAKIEKPKAPTEKAKADKPNSSAAKKVKDVKPAGNEDDDSDDDDSDDDDEEDESDDEEMAVGVSEDDSSDGEDDSSEDEDEDEDTPKNAKQSKKRPVESATKTPAPEKKAKLVTPQKSGGDGKKGGNTHTATPHPSKQAGKTKVEKSKSPKSAGQVVCKACTKTFNSDGALQSHTKAKHSDAK